MKTSLAAFIKDTDTGREADAILRSCVHCGFCNATCPTYQLLGDELDGPRGRIYLIKEVLEGNTPTAATRLHLDRCLTCRNCETTCPSGVRYGRLIDIGRDLVESQAPPRKPWERKARELIRSTLLNADRFSTLLTLGQRLRPMLPGPLKRSVPVPSSDTSWPAPQHKRKMLVLAGCVQPSIAPNINAAAARVLDRLGISLIVAPDAGCCGAVSQHTSATADALDFARRNIDAWLPHLDVGVEAIVMTASGCGVHVKEYGYYLRNDPAYAEKAKRIAAAVRDLSEILRGEDLANLKPAVRANVAFQSPCSLQHGQKLSGVVEEILQKVGFSLVEVPDGHLCCGSAGTYSILHPVLARRLRRNKLSALSHNKPDVIATANVGCLTHLQAGTDLPVRHWIELLAD